MTIKTSYYVEVPEQYICVDLVTIETHILHALYSPRPQGKLSAETAHLREILTEKNGLEQKSMVKFFFEEDNLMTISSEEGGLMTTVSICTWLSKHYLYADQVIVLEYALHTHPPKVGGHGGGVFVFTSTKNRHVTTTDSLVAILKEVKPSRAG